MKKSQTQIMKWWLIAAVVLCVVIQAVQAQGTTRYVYDNNGRLRAVIAPNGEAAIYDYDPAGNFTAIRRLTADDLEIIEFTPREGAIGAEVTIFGVGFNSNLSNVSFNGATAQIISQTATSAVVTVPNDATTGPISIASPKGTRTSTEIFTVKGIGIFPHTATVASGRALQFTALISGLVDSSIVWSVSGVVGGNSSAGTITTGGFYVAPNVTTTASNQYIIRATSTFEPSIFGEATVNVPGIGGGYDAISTGVSVRYGTPTPPIVVPSFATGAVSVRYGTPTPPSSVPSFTTNAVSVRYGTPAPPTSVPSFTTGAVSVRYGTPTPPSSIPSFVATAVSTRYGAATLMAERSGIPSINALSLTNLSVGTSVTVTVTGANLVGVNSLQLLNEDGTVDRTISISDLQVSADGNSLTVQMSVQAQAKVGARILQIITSAGKSTSNNLGTNTVQIVP